MTLKNQQIIMRLELNMAPSALIDGYKFDTSLREDVLTDGRHAHVRYSKDWKNIARRDLQ